LADGHAHADRHLRKTRALGSLIFYEVDMEIVNDADEPVIREKTTRILR
jgi:hypothetical protein